MSAREKILDSYQLILLEQGERAATMDQVAARAGVSKGGLLYHFRDKAAMAAALLERVRELLAEDLAKMAAASEGPAAYYLRGSLLQGDPLDRTLLAAMQLAPEHDAAKIAVYREVQEGWRRIILSEIPDGAIADAIMLMGDGLYWNASMMSTLDDAAGAQQEWETARMAGLAEVLNLLRRASLSNGREG